MSKIESINKIIKDIDDNELISDGWHTFEELYNYRMTYNALLFNEWYKNDKYGVIKSKRHFDGEECFGGGWFIVIANTPKGQIDNHYKIKYWDLFKVQEMDKSPYKFDGHTPADALKTMNELIK